MRVMMFCSLELLDGLTYSIKYWTGIDGHTHAHTQMNTGLAIYIYCMCYVRI